MTNNEVMEISNNETSDPVGDYVCNYLLSQTKETPFLDFKWTIDVSKKSQEFLKIIKDVYAFSNYGGGWLVLGIKENDYSDLKIKGKFIQSGLPDNFTIEDAVLQEKINSKLEIPIEIKCREYIKTINDIKKKFILIYIPPSSKIIMTTKDVKYKINKKEKIIVVNNKIYTRRGTQSIIASNYEKKMIEKRIEKENYRLSILSGEPEEIHEIIYSNLFKIKKIPKYINVGIAKYKTFKRVCDALKDTHPNKTYFPLKYNTYENKIITFEDLNDTANIHNEIVQLNKISKESIEDWLKDSDKNKIIISLLYKKIIDEAEQYGLSYDNKTRKLYYKIDPSNKERKEKWPTRYKGVKEKRVVNQIWDDEQKTHLYLHGALKISIMQIKNKFYLRLNPTMMITKDGKTPQVGMREGAIITGQTYRTYNKQQLNNILFWINKLGNGKDIVPCHDFIISNTPIKTSMEIGISWDIPTSDLKKHIEKFDNDAEQKEIDDEMEDEVYEF